MSRVRAVFGAVLATLVAVSFVPGVAGASILSKPKPEQYVLPGNAVFPEGVAYQQGTPYFYVSSTTDGTIYRGDLGNPTAEVFLPGGTDGRTTATGLKVDRQGRLFVSGAGTGKIFVYDTATKQLLGSFDNGLQATFINDVAVARDGTAYFTDSVSPYLYRVTTDENGKLSFEKWLDFTGTVFQYQQGFNANGIDITNNGKYLVIVQSNTGKLFRVEIATKQVSQIDLGGATVTNGDGILLQGRTLYVVRNSFGLIAKIELAGDLSRGTLVSQTGDDSLIYPTTIALARGKLLVVNSQFNNRGGTPVLPFTVSSIPVP